MALAVRPPLEPSEPEACSRRSVHRCGQARRVEDVPWELEDLEIEQGKALLAARERVSEVAKSASPSRTSTS